MVHGTGRSGVAIQASGDPDFDAEVLAHEIGHIGGLFHTTEISIELTDPLSDTVFCDSAVISSNPGQCPDISNMMFPLAAGGGVVSPAQAMVMRGSALYRGTLIAGGQPSAPAPPVAASKVKRRPRLAWLAASGTPVAEQRMRRATDVVEKLLGGVWCSRSHGYEAAVLGRASASRLARVEQLALDGGAFDIVRARALRVLAYAKLERRLPIHLARVAGRVLRSRPGRHTALAAIDILKRHEPAALEALAGSIRSLGDEVVTSRLGR
jgi:hypothetical protein